MSEDAFAALSSDKKTMARLLSYGMSQANVATHCRVDPSYVSQCMADEVFISYLNALKGNRVTGEFARLDKINSLMDKSIKQLEQTLPLVFDPMKLVHTIDRLASIRKTLSEPVAVLAAEGQNLAAVKKVRFEVAAHRLPNIVKTETGEVIEVNGESLLPMQSKNVLELANIPVKSMSPEEYAEKLGVTNDPTDGNRR